MLRTRCLPWLSRARISFAGLACASCAWLTGNAASAEEPAKMIVRPAVLRPLGEGKEFQPSPAQVGSDKKRAAFPQPGVMPLPMPSRSNFMPVADFAEVQEPQPMPQEQLQRLPPLPGAAAPHVIDDPRFAQVQPRPGAVQPAPMPQPGPGPGPAAIQPAAQPAMPVDLTHPFETIGETGELTLMIGALIEALGGEQALVSTQRLAA